MSSSMSWQSLRIEIIDTSERFAAVAAPWSCLWSETNALAFQSHAWVAAWWNTLPANHRHSLRIGLVWKGDRLLAVLPLAVTRRSGLRFLEWAAITCTDYPDVLASPDCPPETLAELWSAVLASGGFDLIQLARLLPDARARTMVSAAMSDGPRLRLGHRSEVSYRVVGDYAGEGGWLAKQSKKTRQNYRRGRKQLEEGAHTIRFRLLDITTEPLEPILARFTRLKLKWLTDTHRQSDLLEAQTGAVDALVGVLKELGILRVFVLERDGEIVALSINFEQRGVMMAFVTTYDPAFERASPGAVLIMEYIQWSAEHGLGTVDFLCGAERFKLRFADEAVTLETLVAPRTILGHAALLANRLRLALKRRQSVSPEPGGHVDGAAPTPVPAR